MTKKETHALHNLKTSYPEVHYALSKGIIFDIVDDTWNDNAWSWELILACAPFAMLRSSHRGYAETENINSYEECYKQLKQSFAHLREPNASGTRLYIPAYMKNGLIKTQQIRMQQNNGIYQARLLARLVYLHEQEANENLTSKSL